MFSIDQLRVFTEPQQGATYDQLLAVAQRAEQLGFGAFIRSDHYLAMGDALRAGGLPGPTDAWTTLAGLARDTSTIRLGTLVSSATFRLPGPLAITIAQVDAMSGGRVELGIGAGWYEQEHRAYGIPFAPLGERFDRLDEQLAVITGLWSTPVGERFSYDGTALPGHRLAGAAQARAGGRRADHRGRRRAQAHAGPRRPLRGRVQHAVPARRALRRATGAGRGRRARRSAATRRRSATRRRRSSASAPTTPSTSGGPRPSAVSRPSSAPTASPARRTRWWRACSGGSTPGPSGCTCRCSTSPTSTTSTPSPGSAESPRSLDAARAAPDLGGIVWAGSVSDPRSSAVRSGGRPMVGELLSAGGPGGPTRIRVSLGASGHRVLAEESGRTPPPGVSGRDPSPDLRDRSRPDTNPAQISAATGRGGRALGRTWRRACRRRRRRGRSSARVRRRTRGR